MMPMDKMDEKENSVKCPSCGEMLKLESASADKMEDKPMDKPAADPMAPKKPSMNAAKAPMDSLKSALVNASNKPNQPGM